MIKRTSASHGEGGLRDWAVATKRFEGSNGKVEKLVAARVERKDGKMQEVPGSAYEIKADLVLLAMGFVGPVQTILDAFGTASRRSLRRARAWTVHRQTPFRLTPCYNRRTGRCVCEGGPVKFVHGAFWTEELYSLQIDANLEPFRAGQFKRLALEINGGIVARSYSFVNAPDERLCRKAKARRHWRMKKSRCFTASHLSARLGVWRLRWKQRNNDLGLWKTVTVMPGRLHLQCKVVASTVKRY